MLRLGARELAPGGFVEADTSTTLRARLTAAQIAAFMPSRGAFTFPAPYNTQGVRLTTGADCGGADCVQPVGYSYWRNINNHAGSDTMLIFLSLDRARGGTGPTLFSYNKVTGETKNLGALFDASTSYGWATGEGWYFSATRPTTLYVFSGAQFSRYDVATRTLNTVFDVTQQFGAGTYLWQLHSSNDDAVHSFTLRQTGTWATLGCGAYSETAERYWFFPKRGDYDECQIDKSGRYLMIKENVDGAAGEDNVIEDLATGTERIFYDQLGAGGHSDNGFGYEVAEDNWNAQPGAVRVFRFDQEQSDSSNDNGRLVFHSTSWDIDAGHIAHANAASSTPLSQQYACSSTASRLTLPRANEVLCYRLDGSLQSLVVAPVMTDLNAAGGGTDDYSKYPKGNLDPTGEYFIWTSNLGGNRLDAIIVRVPSQNIPGGAPLPAPPPAPAPEPAPAPSADAVQWTSMVNAIVVGSVLTKNGGCSGCGDSGAVSQQQLPGGDGYFEFTASETTTLRAVGLSNGNPGTSISEIGFALRLQAGVAEVREKGAYKSDTTFATGDILRIAVSGGQITYSKNGTAFYTSTTAPTYPLVVDACLADAGSTIANAIFSIPAPVSVPTPVPPPPPTPAPEPTPAPAPPPDTTMPVVALTSPTAGATVSATLMLSASATDDSGVAGVQFLLDNNPLGAIVAAVPYTLSWDSTGVGDGTHVLAVRAQDAAGNIATSTSVTVTVANVPPLAISAVQASTITASSAIVQWTTSQLADSEVQYGTSTSYGHSTGIDGTLTTSHSKTLSGLLPQTTYHYRVRSKTAMMLVTSGDFTFTTSAAKKPLRIKTVSVAGVTKTSATLAWETDAPSAGKVVVGTDTGSGASTSTASALEPTHQQVIGGLTPGTTYAFQITAWNDDDEVVSAGTFATAAPDPVDTTPPDASITAPAGDQRVRGRVEVTARIQDDSAIRRAQFRLDGKDLDGGLASAPWSLTWDTTKVSDGAHRLAVEAEDDFGNRVVSADVVVSVANALPLSISALQVPQIDLHSATITWTTNFAADSTVEFGPRVCGDFSVTLPAQTTEHSVSLTQLEDGTSYCFRVRSRTPEGEAAASAALSFTTTLLLRPTGPPSPDMTLDTPASGRVSQPFVMAGWALDRGAGLGAGIDAVHVWAWPVDGRAPTFVGAAGYGWNRSDVGGVFGRQFDNSGYGIVVNGLAPGSYHLVASARSTVSGTFSTSRMVDVEITVDSRIAIDGPRANEHVGSTFTVGGWAVDLADGTGNGVDVVHVYARNRATGAMTFVGAGLLGGQRPDVAGIFGSRFVQSGYMLTASGLSAGAYDIIVYARSAGSRAISSTAVTVFVD